MKLRVRDRRELLRQLARLGAELIAARVHEMNTLYDTPEDDLARQGRMLRVRVERPASRSKGAGQRGAGQKGTGKARAREESGLSALLTFKGPVGPVPGGSKRDAEKVGKQEKAPAYKIREEHEIRVSDREELSRIMDGLGLRPSFRYEKFRTTYRLPGIGKVKVEVDETPIGLFLELEGPRREIDRAAARLGFGRAEYISKSYGALFIESGGGAGGGTGRFKSLELAGAEGAGKFHPEPAHDRVDEQAKAQPGVAVPRGEPTRFSGLRDMLFRSAK